MDGQINLINLIALIVLAVAVWKLKSVLGARTSDDDARVQRMRSKDRSGVAPGDGESGDIINLPRREREERAAAATSTLTGDVEARIKSYPAQDAEVTRGLLDIAKLDPAFSPEAFLSGAGRAYEMIVSAFAAGNRKVLRDLLSRDVYDGFIAAIGEREERGEVIDQQFVGLNKSDIVEAEVKDRNALITVKFVSQLITATRDRNGIATGGDSQKIREVTDIWTFSRDVSSKRALENLNWRLVGTQAPN